MKNTFWEDKIYGQGKHFNKYPYDMIVSFVFNHYPRDKEREKIKILEVGCGAGNNLWFAAKENFQVTGIDSSKSAIEFSRNRFKEEKLQGTFLQGDFSNLPFSDNHFDLVIDRAAITCCGWEEIEIILGEIYRVLAPSGKFLFNVYSDQHSSYSSGEFHPDGTKINMTEGTLKGIQHIYFFDQRAILKLFPSSRWNMLSCQHHEISEMLKPASSFHAEWTVILEKK